METEQAAGKGGIMEAGFDYKGILQLKNQLMQIENGFSAWLKDFLLRQAEEALEQIRRSTPADIAGLREVWKISSVKQSGSSLTVTLINDHDQASSVEYGSMDEQRTQWKEGTFVCTLALKDMQRRMPEHYRREFGTWLRGLGVDAR